MAETPAFRFYPGDYLASQRVQMLSLDEEGAYLRLMCYCWNHGSIPADPEQLARLIGKGASTTLATVVQAMFQPDTNRPGRLVHDRLEAERVKQQQWREKSAAGGRKGAESRKNGKGASTTLATVVEDCFQPNGNIPFPFPFPLSDNTPLPPKGGSRDVPKKPRSRRNRLATEPEPAGFERFWDLYPSKVNRRGAIASFLREDAGGAIDDVMAGLAKDVSSGKWKEEAGRYIPNPTTWLNQRRWEAKGPKVSAPVLTAADCDIPENHLPPSHQPIPYEDEFKGLSGMERLNAIKTKLNGTAEPTENDGEVEENDGEPL